MNKKDLFRTSPVGDKKQKLILKGLWGLKNKYSPGGIKVKYQHSDLNEDIPEEFINPQPQMDYYAWWLDNRRKLLELNMKDTGLYPDLNGREYFRNILNGYLPGRIALNKEIYNQLGRISDTIYEYDNTYNPVLTTNNGQYFKDKDGVPTVVIKKGLDKNKQYYTILHELVHNGNNPKQIISGVYDSDSATSPLEKKIKLIGVNVNKEYDDMIKNLPEYVDMLNYERTYLNTPSEIYARMMEFRKENNLNPNKKYSKEEIKKMIDKSKVPGIKAYDIEKLTKALNEVAQNNNLSKNYNFYAKQGGKMNILEFLKNGSGIHIKEKNKGKFTSYCGGKVTDECIRKAKSSGNPTLVKRATFALNARRWKHKEGGIIKANAGTQLNTNTTTNNSNSKINWRSLLNNGVDYIGQMLPSILNSGGNSSSLQIPDTSDAMADTTLLYLLLLQQQAQAIRDLDTVLKSLYDRENPNANGGDIVRNHYKWLTLAPQLAQLKELQLLLKKLLDTLNKLKKASVINDALTTTLLTGLGLVNNYIGNKKGSSVS